MAGHRIMARCRVHSIAIQGVLAYNGSMDTAPSNNRSKTEPTEKQRRVFEFIVEFTRRNHHQPSLWEMAEGLGYKHATSMTSHMNALERKGWIRRRKGVARNLELLKWPGE
jgi:hypothetical protein